MKENQEKMHVCKLCKKSFLTGKMLGGHMRVHRAASSVKENIKLESSNMGSDSYGLRENPKKSRKFSVLDHDDSVAMKETPKCRVCGKEFVSPKSLHGHMRHHSAKERKRIYCEDCGRGFLSSKSLTNHKRLHNGKFSVLSESGATPGINLVVMALSAPATVNLVRRKRSSRTRYKITPDSSFSSLNESVSGFDIDQEVEEVAFTLIMMSRGERNRFNSSFQSKPFENEIDELGRHVSDGNKLFKLKNPKGEDFDSFDVDSNISASECGGECDYETGCEGENQAIFDVPIESFYMKFASKSHTLDDESGAVVCAADLEKGIHSEIISNWTEAEYNQDLMGEPGLDIAGLGFEKSILSNQARFDACDAEMRKTAPDKILVTTPGSDIVQGPGKRGDYMCRICNKKFISYQSLGGHQTYHRKSGIVVKVDSCEQNIQTNFSPETEATGKLVKLEHIQESVMRETDDIPVKDCVSKEGKEHKCPICSKVFLSGQALGGHKRAHFSKSKEEQDVAMNQEVSDIYDALNINVPCTAAAEASSDVLLESWWPANSLRHEPLVGLLAN